MKRPCLILVMRRFARAAMRSLAVLGLLELGAAVVWGDAPRVLPAGKKPNDQRLGALKDLNGYFPLKVPASPQEWEKRAERVRRQTARGVAPHNSSAQFE